MSVVVSTEIVNILILNTNNTILDVIMNFLAIIVISEFDDYFFSAQPRDFIARAISEGSFKRKIAKTEGEEDDIVELADLFKIKTTTSPDAIFSIDEHRINY